MLLSELIHTRPAEECDHALIMSSWLQGYRYGSSFGRSQQNRVFFPDHHAIVTAILERPTVTTIVAHSAGEPALVLGFVVAEDADAPVLHWAYTKEPFRQMGICTTLLKAAGLPHDLAGVELSHVSDSWFTFGKRSRPAAIYRHGRQYWSRAPDHTHPVPRVAGRSVDHRNIARRKGCVPTAGEGDAAAGVRAHREQGGGV